jgi:predicted site-specific integrase-resolvase
MLGELVRKTEVVKLFDVDPRTVSRWVREGKLAKPIRPGGTGHAYFRREDVEKLLKGERSHAQDQT